MDPRVVGQNGLDTKRLGKRWDFGLSRQKLHLD